MASILRNYHFTSIFLLLIIILMASTYQATSRTMHEEIMHTRYEQWMTRHKRVYVTSEEKQKRFKIFKTNVEFIENFNKDPNRTYTLGTNKFTDLTTEEFLATHTGYKRPSSENSSTTNTPKSFRYQNMGYLPNSIDWRQLGAVTNVKNQQQCGCCWAFSAVAALEGLIQIQNGYLFSLSEQEVLDCMTENGCYGNLPDNAFEFIKRNGGLTTESAYPYMGYQERSCGYVNNNRRYGSIEGYEDVPQNDEFALQRAVAHQPVTIGIDPMILHHYRYGIIGGYCGQNLSHAVTIVGYGTSEDGIRYWLCKNSWGTNWGEDGYFRILRDSGVEGGMCGIALAPSYPVA